VRWTTEEDARKGGIKELLRRAGTGTAVGLFVAAFSVVFVLATRAASFAPFAPAAAALLLGCVTAILHAVREEMLFRGLVLRVLPPATPPILALLVCGLAGACGEIGGVFASPLVEGPARATLSFGEGVLFAALWQRDRGAWMAVAAHATWRIAMGPLLSGGLLDLRFVGTAWGGGRTGARASWAVATAMLVMALALVALHTWSRTRGRGGRTSSRT
jgi:membrane protease YdiL (CAAX protease family)